MKHAKEKLDAVFKHLLDSYKQEFGVSAPQEQLKVVFEELLAQLSKQYIANRVNGLDAAGMKYLISKLTPEEAPVIQSSPVVDTKQRGRPKTKNS